jgi:hypothetical protein
MAISQADLDVLDAAIVASELEVQMADGRRVRYRSMSELMAARSFAASALAQGSGGATRPTGSFRYDMIGSRDC